MARKLVSVIRKWILDLIRELQGSQLYEECYRDLFLFLDMSDKLI